MRALAVALGALVPLWSAGALGVAALTVPANGISSCRVAPADGGTTVDSLDVAVTSPTADSREIAAGATASDGSSFPGLYEGSFAYTCLLTGAASLAYGSASGSLSLDASSTPDLLLPSPGNPNDPFSNSGYARGEALLELQFDDSGTILSDTLADGTPVELELHFELTSAAVAVGPPLGPLLAASATYFAKATDSAAPGTPAEAILSGTESATRTLSTAVGRTIDLQGKLALYVLGLAGREVPGALYYAEAMAEVDASNTALFTLALPDGVAFESESGHDYTAAPAPSRAALALAGALTLALVRCVPSRARRRAAGGG